LATESRMLAAAPLASLVLAVCAPGLAQESNPTQASTALYVRSDTDNTTVVTPRLRVGAPLAESSRLDLVYTVDVWSSASIDVRTAASLDARGNYKYVVEQRDEIDVSAEHGLGDSILGASYRYSVEYDYESHGGSLGLSQSLAEKATTLALTARAYFDRVGRAGDPSFDRPLRQLGMRASFNQVLTPEAFVSAAYELTHLEGYQASPYRSVRFGETPQAWLGGCVLPVKACKPENNPNTRLRHALALSGRHALSDGLSAGLGYRFYIDDWELMSHTLDADAAFGFGEGWLVSAAYRFYTQGSAAHFESLYPADYAGAYYTGDKELSALSSHRLALELSKRTALDELGSELGIALRISPSYYLYDAFALLDDVSAIEATIATELSL